MTANSDRFYVITGGPGSGKTSLVTALGSRGYNSTAEAGRAIIQDQVAIDGVLCLGATRSTLPNSCSPWICSRIAWPNRLSGRCSSIAAFPTCSGICA